MKVLWRIWTFIINITLIFLPLLIVGLLIFYYGRPIANRFGDFLGNPVNEFVSMATEFKQRKPAPKLYQQAGRLLSQLAPRNELAEEEAEKLRTAVFKIHRGTVEQVGLEEENTTDTPVLKAYEHFLNTPQLDRLFVHSDDLRTSLNQDLDRMRQLTNLPFHPARGLKLYIAGADTTNKIIRKYGSIYADQYTCRQVFRQTCGSVYSASTSVASQQIGQYLKSWPQPGRGGDAGIVELNKNLLKLHGVYQMLTRKISGYLQADPWVQYKEFQKMHSSFKENFVADMQLWYKNSISRLQIEPTQFTDSAIPDITPRLLAIKEIEETLKTGPQFQQLLLNNENQKIRRDMENKLRETYSRLLAKQNFEDQFEISRPKFLTLRETISSLPDGTEFITKQENLLRKTELKKEALQTALAAQNYSLLRQKLRELEQTLQDDANIMDKIMLTNFLSDSINTFTDPAWLPLDSEGQQNYSQLITHISDLGQRLEIEKINPQWKQNAIISMKSRRFTVLKNKIKSVLTDPGSDLTGELVGKLKELTSLEDLPGPLADKPRIILLNATLLERIQAEESGIHRAFSSEFKDDSTLENRWKEIDSTLQIIEEHTPTEALEKLDLKSFIQEYIQVLSATDDSEPLGELVKQELTSRLEKFLNSLCRQGERWLRAADRRNISLAGVEKRYDNLLGGVEKARQVEKINIQRRPEQWLNLLHLRQQLLKIQKLARDLGQGSLIGENPIYLNFKETLAGYKYRPLPSNYDFPYEKEIIRYTHKTVLEKARIIEKKAQNQWLSGWGGRLRGVDVLEPWENFMSEFRKGSNDTAVRTLLREYLAQSLNLRGEW